MKKNRFPLYIIIAVVMVLFDQATKLAVKGFSLLGLHHEGLRYGEVIPVIGNVLQWTYIENQGMALGITFGWGKIFLSLFSLVASGIIIHILYKYRKELTLPIGLGTTLVLSGAFGNAIDRCFYGVFYGTDPLFYGRVVDFILVDIPDISFGFINYSHFPVFNIADSCVTIGVIILLIFYKQLPIKHREESTNAIQQDLD